MPELPPLSALSMEGCRKPVDRFCLLFFGKHVIYLIAPTQPRSEKPGTIARVHKPDPPFYFADRSRRLDSHAQCCRWRERARTEAPRPRGCPYPHGRQPQQATFPKVWTPIVPGLREPRAPELASNFGGSKTRTWLLLFTSETKPSIPVASHAMPSRATMRTIPSKQRAKPARRSWATIWPDSASSCECGYCYVAGLPRLFTHTHSHEIIGRETERQARQAEIVPAGSEQPVMGKCTTKREEESPARQAAAHVRSHLHSNENSEPLCFGV
jgi:hypothetical protein